MSKRRILDSYARESKRGDRRDLSINGQHEVNERRIRDLGCDLGLKLQDKGKSAWRKGVVRPDWETMVKRLETGDSDGAVIFDVERLLRTVEDALRIVKLAERGLRRGFKIYDSDMEYDLTSVSGQDAFYKAAVSAQTYSHRLSKKITRGNRQKALNGEGKRGRYRAFGFENDSTTVRESEREPIRHVVRMILEERKRWEDATEYLTRLGIYSTAIAHTPECIEREQALSPYQRRSYECDCEGPPWETGALQKALKSDRMVGYAKIGETMGKLPGEPILELADWQELKNLIASRRGRPPAEAALLSGSAPARCWNCGGEFRTKDTAHFKTYQDAGEEMAKLVPDPTAVRRFYYCTLRGSVRGSVRGCGKTIADVHILNLVVGGMVIDKLSSTESAEELARIQQERRELREPFENEVARLERVRDYWDQQLNDGVEGMTPERHAVMTRDANTKIRTARSRLEEIGAPADVATAVESRETVIRKWNAAKPADKREMLRQAFSERTIYVQPGSALDLIPAVAERIKTEPRQSPPELR
jgi:site-specific DNA recombinase